MKGDKGDENEILGVEVIIIDGRFDYNDVIHGLGSY